MSYNDAKKWEKSSYLKAMQIHTQQVLGLFDNSPVKVVKLVIVLV